MEYINRNKKHIILLSSLMIFHVANEVNSFESVRFKRQEKPDKCTTLDGDPGICIPIKECESMFNFLVTNKHDLTVRQRIRKSHCGFIDKHPKVCCNVSIIESPSSTLKPPLSTPIILISTPSDRLSTEKPLPSTNIPSTTFSTSLPSSEITSSISEPFSSTTENSPTLNISLATSQITTTSTDIPITTIKVPLSSTDIPITTIKIPLSSTDSPISIKVPLSSTDIPATTVKVPLQSTDIPATTVEVPLQSTDIPITTSAVLLSLLDTITSEGPLLSSQNSSTESEDKSLEIPLQITAEREKSSVFDHFPSDCGRTVVSTKRLISGLAPLNAWPWLALLGYSVPNKTDLNFACIGSLITNRHVLTAAHCLRNTGTFQLKIIRLGEHETNSTKDGANPIDIEIDSLMLHEEYDKINHSSDIGIVTLKNAVTFTESVRPICLPFADHMRSKNYTATTNYIAGWGAQGSSSQASHQLLETKVPVISTEECKESPTYKDKTFIKLDERTICAGGGESDACRGDSGTPLMFEEADQIYTIGHVSFGTSLCGVVGSYTVYTRVTYFLEWIAKNTQ